MITVNLLLWCDEKISYLKTRGIRFADGIPQLPDEYVYKDIPYMISTFAYRNDIPVEKRKASVLSFFMFEEKLWPRLKKIDEDIDIFQDYGGVTGFDFSPSVKMIRPRQKFSILLNAVYSCYCGLRGIKILPNYRPGDMGTICAADYFPNDCNFIVGNHGCNNNGFKDFGRYVLQIVLRKKKPGIIFFYGGISKAYALSLISRCGCEIITFPDRRNRVRNKSKSYHYFLSDKMKVCKEPYLSSVMGGME